MSERRGYGVLVFFAAFCCLLFELVISRLADQGVVQVLIDNRQNR